MLKKLVIVTSIIIVNQMAYGMQASKNLAESAILQPEQLQKRHDALEKLVATLVFDTPLEVRRSLVEQFEQLSQDAFKAGLDTLSEQADERALAISRTLLPKEFAEGVEVHMLEIQTESEAAESLLELIEQKI